MEHTKFRLPPQTYVLSIENLVRLSRLYNGLVGERTTKGAEFSRRDFPDWMTDQLTSIDGNIVDDRGKIVWNNLDEQNDQLGEDEATMSVDRAFNDDLSFRWVSDFSDYALNPPACNHLKRIAWRMQLITASFLISGRYAPQVRGWKNTFLSAQ